MGLHLLWGHRNKYSHLTASHPTSLKGAQLYDMGGCGFVCFIHSPKQFSQLNYLHTYLGRPPRSHSEQM